MRIKKRSRLKIKEWSLGFLGLGVLVIVAALPLSASAISLKQSSIVENDTIKLGDIFEGLETNADKVLGASPQPGNDMVLNATTLMRIAVALDLPWRPSSNADQVVLKRPATVIERPMIEEVVRNELLAQDLPGKYQLLFAATPEKIILPPEETQSIEVISFNANPETKRFEAVLAAPSKEKPIQQINVSGTLQRMVNVPVLREVLQNGSMISDGDLEYVDMREEAVNHDVILKAEEMIGMTPRRQVLAGKAIKKTDLMSPQVVARGELVTMVFADKGLSLTAQGKAMQNGAKGDVIRVVNASSSKTIEAIVTGDKEVTVQSF